MASALVGTKSSALWSTPHPRALAEKARQLSKQAIEDEAMNILGMGAQAASGAANEATQEATHQQAKNEVTQSHRRQQEFERLQEQLKTITRAATAAKDVVR